MRCCCWESAYSVTFTWRLLRFHFRFVKSVCVRFEFMDFCYAWTHCGYWQVVFKDWVFFCRKKMYTDIKAIAISRRVCGRVSTSSKLPEQSIFILNRLVLDSQSFFYVQNWGLWDLSWYSLQCISLHNLHNACVT